MAVHVARLPCPPLLHRVLDRQRHLLMVRPVAGLGAVRLFALRRQIVKRHRARGFITRVPPHRRPHRAILQPNALIRVVFPMKSRLSVCSGHPSGGGDHLPGRPQARFRCAARFVFGCCVRRSTMRRQRVGLHPPLQPHYLGHAATVDIVCALKVLQPTRSLLETIRVVDLRSPLARVLHARYWPVHGPSRRARVAVNRERVRPVLYLPLRLHAPRLSGPFGQQLRLGLPIVILRHRAHHHRIGPFHLCRWVHKIHLRLPRRFSRLGITAPDLWLAGFEVAPNLDGGLVPRVARCRLKHLTLRMTLRKGVVRFRHSL
mmetsp:Transcript_37245/g.66669  ORF Transcript_37245/g.66669 Transcript_37245/m.66669 type:complete len:317 (-) Transcript_37245:218-1168(-)